MSTTGRRSPAKMVLPWGIESAFVEVAGLAGPVGLRSSRTCDGRFSRDLLYRLAVARVAWSLIAGGISVPRSLPFAFLLG
jgi:hypothetical protein